MAHPLVTGVPSGKGQTSSCGHTACDTYAITKATHQPISRELSERVAEPGHMYISGLIAVTSLGGYRILFGTFCGKSGWILTEPTKVQF
jgi:hypothetical protein